MTTRPKRTRVQIGSGNVFADLGVPEPEQELVKSDLVRAIGALLVAEGKRQVDLAARLGISQPKVSLLMRGRSSGFSTELLMRLLNRLGQSIEIVVRPAPAGRRVGVTRVDCPPGRGARK